MTLGHNQAKLSDKALARCYDYLEFLQEYVNKKGYKTFNLKYKYDIHLDTNNGYFVIIYNDFGATREKYLYYSPCVQSEESFIQELKATCLDIIYRVETI